MNKSFYSIFKSFFKVGAMLLGGGYVILPLLQSELVDKKGWINTEELTEFFVLSQSIPGLIAANIAIFIGFKIKGFMGALAAISGVITPAFLAIILLANLLETIVNFNIIQNIFWGVSIGVIMLIYLATKEMVDKSVKDKITGIIFIITFMASACFKIPPAVIISIAILTGILLNFYNSKKEHLQKLKVKE